MTAVGMFAAAALIAAGCTTGSAEAHNWIATGWNIHMLRQASPAMAAHFFKRRGSYGTGSALGRSPVIDGFGTSPVLVYKSYGQFAYDVRSGAITHPYRWVLYDPEHWSQTPLREQRDPRTYLRRFAQLAHAYGYRVIEMPGRDLGLAPGSACARPTGETLDRWYVRCDLAGMAAAHSDLVVVQDQVDTPNLGQYEWLFNQARRQALRANPLVAVDAGLSTNYGTPTQMAAAAESVSADGFYVTITRGAISRATQFFKKMRAVGY